MLLAKYKISADPTMWEMNYYIEFSRKGISHIQYVDGGLTGFVLSTYINITYIHVYIYAQRQTTNNLNN